MYCILLLAAMAATAPTPVVAAQVEAERAAITAAALDYAEGYFEGSGERMERAVSPLLAKRGLMIRPGVPPFVMEMNADTLVEAARLGGGKLAPGDRRLTVDVLDVNGEVASARVFTSQFNDYLHLVKRNGRWQLLSVLWHAPPAPAAPADRAAVERAAREYVAAIATGDVERARTVVHPGANLRTLAPSAPGRPRIVREQNLETLCAGLASGQAKLGIKAEDAGVTVFGVDADIASARLTLGRVTTYLHLALQNGAWRVVNALAYPAP